MFEKARAVMRYGRQSAMLRFFRQSDFPAMEVADSLMTQTNAQNGKVCLPDDIAADAEICRPVRSSRSRRNDNIVEIPDHIRLPARIVISDDDRSTIVDGCNQMVEIVSERIVVIDQQRSNQFHVSHTDIIVEDSGMSGAGVYGSSPQPYRTGKAGIQSVHCRKAFCAILSGEAVSVRQGRR